MAGEKLLLLAADAVLTLILCGAGVLCRKRDLFAWLHHPLREKFPHISKLFGTVMIGFGLFWLGLMVLLAAFDTP